MGLFDWARRAGPGKPLAHDAVLLSDEDCTELR
jgi:hypothetical protein